MENKLVRERIEGCRRGTPAAEAEIHSEPSVPGEWAASCNARWPREVSPQPESRGASSEISGSPLFTAGLPQHFHLNIEQKDDSRRVEDLGVTQAQHFGYTKSFLIWFLLTLSSSYTPLYPPFTPHFLENAHSPVKTQSKIYLF